MEINDLTGYELSRSWFNFCFEYPDLAKPTHTALFFFAIEHCNRLGWKKRFGLPTMMTKEAIGVRSTHTYIKAFNDIVDWGFFILIEKAKNQYSSNIIALSINNTAQYKALDTAMIRHGFKYESAMSKNDKASEKHSTKHEHTTVHSTHQSIDTINKQETINNKPVTINERAMSNSYMADSVTRISNPTIDQCREVAQLSGHDPRYGEAYFHMRNADNWLKARGKGEHKQMLPIGNWRSDYITCKNAGYLKIESPDGLNFL